MCLQLLLIYFVSGLTASAQNTTLFIGGKLVKPDSVDRVLLIEKEKQIIKIAYDSNTVIVFDNAPIDNQFLVRCTKMQVHDMYRNTDRFEKRTSFLYLITATNHTADSIYFMSCSSVISTKFKSDMMKDTVCPVVLIPLSEYQKIPFTPSDSLLYIRQFSKLLNGNAVNDTINFTIRLTRDSNTYLPQADYTYLFDKILNFMQLGKLPSYLDHTLANNLTKRQLNDKLVRVVGNENSNYPPVIVAAFPHSLIINYQLVPFISNDSLWQEKSHLPQPFAKYSTVAQYAGIEMTGGAVNWFSIADLENLLRQQGFDFGPYEQCIRAEKFRRLNTSFQ